jgi:hypothetical protein
MTNAFPCPGFCDLWATGATLRAVGADISGRLRRSSISRRD